jgi:hypothetical protein
MAVNNLREKKQIGTKRKTNDDEEEIGHICVVILPVVFFSSN